MLGVLTRPRKPKAPPLYCYSGCGIDRQPECITGMVARTSDPALTAVVATAGRILGVNCPGNMRVEATEQRMDADPAMRVVD